MSCEITIDSNNDEYTIGVTGDDCGDFDITLTASGEYDITVNTEGEIIPTESDPVFVASVAYGITTGDTTHWNTAYGWGDHADHHYDASGLAVAQRTAHELQYNHGYIHQSGSDAETLSTIGTLLASATTTMPASADTFPYIQTIGSTPKKVSYATLLTAFESAISVYETSGTMSAHLTSFDHDAFLTDADLLNDYDASGAVAQHLIDYNHALIGGGAYEATGTMSVHLTGFDHSLLHASGSDNQDLSGYSLTGHNHDGRYDGSGAVAAHLLAFDHNSFGSGDYDTSGSLSQHLVDFNHALIEIYETSGTMSQHLTDFNHDLTGLYDASGAVSSHLTSFDHSLIDIYETSGSLSGHLTAFDHALIHAAGSDNQDLSGYSTTGHNHAGIYEASGALSGHLTAFDHAAFLTSAALLNYSTTGHLHTGVYESSGAIASHLIAFNHDLTNLYDASGDVASHLVAFDHSLIDVYETSGEMSGHLTDYDHEAFLVASDLTNDYETSGAVAAHLIAFNHNLTSLYETSGAMSSHLTAWNHAGFLTSASKASDSDKLDGYDSLYYATTGQLANYSTTGHTHSTYMTGDVIWTSLSGTYASTSTFTFAGTDTDVNLCQLSLFTCTSSGGTRKIGYIKSSSATGGTVTATVVTDADLAALDANFKVAYNRKVDDYVHIISIPGEVIADASYSQGVWRQNLKVASYLLPVDSSVLTTASGAGAACAWNVYDGTSNLFSSAPDLATASTLVEQRPTTKTLNAAGNVSLRITSSVGGSNKASDFQAKLYIVPQLIYTVF